MKSLSLKHETCLKVQFLGTLNLFISVPQFQNNVFNWRPKIIQYTIYFDVYICIIYVYLYF